MVYRSYISKDRNYIFYGITQYSHRNYNGKAIIFYLVKNNGWYETLQTTFNVESKSSFLRLMKNLYKKY